MPRGVYQTSAKRGLAASSRKTRIRVAQLGGFVCAIRHGDLFCQARAEAGGEAFVRKYGKMIPVERRT